MIDSTLRMGVVIPLANEESTIDSLIARALAQLSPDDRVFCVVDRASRDRTRERVEAAAIEDSRVRLVWTPENRNVVDAYVSGYRAALDAGARWILEMDGGLSHCPEEIPRFVAAMEAGFDFAAGSRFTRGGVYEGWSWRWLLSRGGTQLSRLLLQMRMRDSTSGFECFTHQALSHVVARGIRSTGHFFQTEIRFALHEWNWVEVPISYRAPSSRVSLRTIIDSLRCLWWLRSLRRRRGAAVAPT